MFEEARKKYNKKQTRNDRKIENYFNHISNDNTHDLACEIIIELGDMHFWGNKEYKYKRKMIDVFKEQIGDLENIVPNFKIANATIHFDESSPHLHIIGVPFKDGNKNGMERQVGKSTIFTKESLRVIQDKMRECCINSFNKVYETDYTLKAKEEGKNEDIKSQNMAKYNEIKKQQEKNQKRLKELNMKKDKLMKESDDIKNKMKNLKPTVLNKNNYTISNDDVNEIIKFINNTKKTTSDLKSANELTTILENYEKDIIEHNNSVKELTNQVKTQNNEINKLKKQNEDLKKDKKDLKKELDNVKNINEKLTNIFETLIEQLKRFFRKLLQLGDEPTKDNTANEVKAFYNHKIFDKDDVYDIAVDTTKEKEIFNFCWIPLRYKSKIAKEQKVSSYRKDKNKENDFDISF